MTNLRTNLEAGGPLWMANLGDQSGGPIWRTNLEDQSGGLIWGTNLEDQSGRDRESVNELMDASATLCV
jgi:hypothetical protein